MRFDSISIYKFINIAIFITALVCSIWIGAQAQSVINKNIYYIYPDLYAPKYTFTYDDIEYLKQNNDWKGLVSFENIDKTYIGFKEITVYSSVVYTDAEYFYINNMNFIQGGPWIEEKNEDDVIVINESLAIRLFGNTLVVGEFVNILGKEFVVTGITSQEKVSKTDCIAWIPYKHMNINAGIQTILLKRDTRNSLSPLFEIRMLLNSIGKSFQNYHVTDINRFVDSITLRHNILEFLLGIFVIYVLFSSGILLYQSGKILEKKVLLSMVFIILSMVATIFILRAIPLNIWAPQFSDPLLTHIFKIITNYGLLPQQQYLSTNLATLDQLNRYSNCFFIAGLFSFINMIFIIRMRSRYNK